MLYDDYVSIELLEEGSLRNQYFTHGPTLHRVPLYLNDYLKVMEVFSEDITLGYIPIFSVQEAKRLEQVEDFSYKDYLFSAILFALQHGCYVLLYPLDYAFTNLTPYK